MSPGKIDVLELESGGPTGAHSGDTEAHEVLCVGWPSAACGNQSVVRRIST